MVDIVNCFTSAWLFQRSACEIHRHGMQISLDSVLTLGEQRVRYTAAGRRQCSRRYENKPSELSWRLAGWSVVAGRRTLSHLVPDSLYSVRATSIELQLTLSYPRTSHPGTSGKPPNGQPHTRFPGKVHFLTLEILGAKTRRAKSETIYLSRSFFILDSVIVKSKRSYFKTYNLHL